MYPQGVSGFGRCVPVVSVAWAAPLTCGNVGDRPVKGRGRKEYGRKFISGKPVLLANTQPDLRFRRGRGIERRRSASPLT